MAESQKPMLRGGVVEHVSAPVAGERLGLSWGREESGGRRASLLRQRAKRDVQDKSPRIRTDMVVQD